MIDQTASRDAIRAATLQPETPLVERLIKAAQLTDHDREAISAQAADLVQQVRAADRVSMMEAFLAEFGLSTNEGVALMCLAEAMLRVPDARTVDALIKDKIAPHDWAAHLGDSGSIMVNASTWALLLTGRILDAEQPGVVGTLRALVRRMGEPVIRKAVSQAMAEMGTQFVLGQDIKTALGRGEEMVTKGYTYSFDMLGEAACTDVDATRYHAAYADAIAAIGDSATHDDIRDNPGISVKLSALHPRYEQGQKDLCLPILHDRLLTLARDAKAAGIGLNIDAEEADRLDLSMDVISAVLSDPSLKGWDGFGVVVQAFGRRAMPVLDYLGELATSLDRKIMIRLVKGAYWDTEVKRAQVLGLEDYPVFTRKSHTDISYLAAARKLLTMGHRIYPQFATHNAHSIAAILHMAGKDRLSFEFQRLHGMGDVLHSVVQEAQGTRHRIYAPVGAHRDLLAYLVRRLLENGANSSFVNQIVDTSVAAEDIAQDPVDQAVAQNCRPHPAIPRPADIFAPRRNAKGWDLTDPVTLEDIAVGKTPFEAPHAWQAKPTTTGGSAGQSRDISSPADPSDQVGTVDEASAEQAKDAITRARQVFPDWSATEAGARAKILRRAADLYEENAPEIYALLAREAGKTHADAVAEIREAVDFLNYYAGEAETLAHGTSARGVIVCISPWNFPLAIFTGQIAAALAAGNTVIAKPAEQTPLIASRAVSWLLEAGLPQDVLQFVPGDGPVAGAALTRDPRIAGVCFTGSTEVAKIIDRQLAETAPDAMLIAETGGMNAMIVDSTALLEQATRDIIRGAFQSAGQRCSALRMLYVQSDIADDLLEMVTGAMDALSIGDPRMITTDVGPVIDAEAHRSICTYLDQARADGRVIKALEVPSDGCFVAPTLLQVKGIAELTREVFGPVLHVARFDADQIDAVVDAVNATGYGLTFGLHSRIDRRVQELIDQIHVGNIYVNRDQIGAVVGSQPFGGHGLSGTGPKAGGPLYLPRFRRSAAPVLPAPASGAVVSTAEAEAALAALPSPSESDHTDRIRLLRSVLRGGGGDAMAAAAALETGPVDLPGPTGESNQMVLFPRGNVLCLGPNPNDLLAQVVQALAAGNKVLAIAPNATDVLHDLTRATATLAALDGRPEPDALTKLPLDLVACAAPDPAIRQALAARNGAIVQLETQTIAPASYMTERTICVDTTAAGGNASLLAKSDG